MWTRFVSSHSTLGWVINTPNSQGTIKATRQYHCYPKCHGIPCEGEDFYQNGCMEWWQSRLSSFLSDYLKFYVCWGNWGSNFLNSLSKVTQLLTAGNVIGMQICITIKLKIIHYILQKKKTSNTANTIQGTSVLSRWGTYLSCKLYTPPKLNITKKTVLSEIIL